MFGSIAVCLIASSTGFQATAGTPTQTPEEISKKILTKGLTELGAYKMLSELLIRAPRRISGSKNADDAVAWAELKMQTMGLQNVRRLPCTVPHWVRGSIERAWMEERSGLRSKLSVAALGGSVATPKDGVTAQVVEVHSLAEAEQLGEKGRGKIVFFNRPMDPTLPSSFAAYGGAVDQRVQGAAAAVKSGAVAVLVRSMTLLADDEPHTGTMRYSGEQKIPAGALGIQSAERLSRALKRGTVTVNLELSCTTLPDATSASPYGDLVGTEFPKEVIVVGGHIDSWDLGPAAHDDGAGITQAIEALRLLKEMGLKPKRTIRVVGFMDEEQRGSGATAFAEWIKGTGEKVIAGIESDSGGFMPRGFTMTEAKMPATEGWLAPMRVFGIERFSPGGGGADVGKLGELGATLFGLRPDDARYFDYHHARTDTIDKVNPRELEFGAMAIAMLLWMISENGI